MHTELPSLYLEYLLLTVFISLCSFQSEKDSKEEILKAFKLFDDDETVSMLKDDI